MVEKSGVENHQLESTRTAPTSPFDDRDDLGDFSGRIIPAGSAVSSASNHHNTGSYNSTYLTLNVQLPEPGPMSRVAHAALPGAHHFPVTELISAIQEIALPSSIVPGESSEPSFTNSTASSRTTVSEATDPLPCTVSSSITATTAFTVAQSSLRSTPPTYFDNTRQSDATLPGPLPASEDTGQMSVSSTLTSPLVSVKEAEAMSISPIPRIPAPTPVPLKFPPSDASTSVSMTTGRSRRTSAYTPIGKGFTKVTLQLRNIVNYLPKSMDVHVKSFMSSKHLGSSTIIPLWNPSTSRPGKHRHRQNAIAVGDVGVFNSNGGFDVSFNAFMDRATNRSCGFIPPAEFVEFVPVMEDEQDGDGCRTPMNNQFTTTQDPVADPAFVWSDSYALELGARYRGFHKNFLRSERLKTNLLAEFEPDLKLPADQVNAATCLPWGGSQLRVNPSLLAQLTEYLDSELPKWSGYLRDLGTKGSSSPAFINSVIVAKAFGCTIYLAPSRKSPKRPPVVKLYQSENGDKLFWEEIGDGLQTMVAPGPSGYDGQGRLRSSVDNQCFGLEGWAFIPQGTPLGNIAGVSRTVSSFFSFRKKH